MFRSARIKLTAWYVLIIMLVSISFSVAMYRVLASELNRVETMHRLRIERRLPERSWDIPPSDDKYELPVSFMLDPNLIEEAKNRLKVMLAVINFAIFGASAAAGYFLAGKTLAPIKEMVDEQCRFITDASHELRTPLTALKSEIEVHLRDKKLTLSQAKKLLASNLEEVNNLQILSDDLIKLTQYQKGNNGLMVSSLSLAEVVDEAVRKVTSLAKKKKIEIVNRVGDFSFAGNRPTLVEMLIIFLDNAIKYSPERSKVNLNSEKTDSQILIHIADQGIGIDAQDIAHLFDRFYRADKSRAKYDLPGYGLGLAIAKQIIERHHGLIKVRSIPNKGTTFTIQIPVKHPRKLI